MIRFNFRLSNPFFSTRRWADQDQKDYVLKDWKIKGNKFLELQVSKFVTGGLLGCELRLTFRGEDHAGLFLEFELFDYSVILNLYDNRHWNYEENRWMTAADHAKEQEEMERARANVINAIEAGSK